MEMDSCCLHLNCVKIDRNFIKNKKLELSSSVATNPPSRNIWRCNECNLNKDNWICLYCGIISCGRYENGHALKHSGQDQDHCLCINANILSVYCYKCDEFVMNDTLDNILEELRQELKDDSDGISETSSTLEEISSSKSTPETVSSTTSSSSDSGWEEPPLIGRKLRPRKRTISSDNNSDSQTQPPQQKPIQPPQHKRNKLKKVVGLRNLGNTCFMNSVLQSLSNIREFSCYFNKLPSLETTKMLQQKQQKTYHSRSMKENLDDVFVVEELRKVLLNLSQGGDGTKGAISPECLFLVIWKVVPQFRGHRQHDAHEFLRYMLDRLHTELQQVSYLPTELNASVIGSTTTATANSKDSKPSSTTTTNNSIFNLSPNISHLNKTQRNSIVTNVFGGTLQSEVRCLVCGMESKKHDPFLDLSLDIPEKFYKDSPSEESNSSKSKEASGAATPTAGGTGCDNSKPKKPICHISDCLSSFTEVEELAETELYYCNSCKCKQKSTKRFWIRRLPNVLCLHIKRFRWNNFFRTKIDLKISFPINSLDMSQFVLNNGPETRRSHSSSNVYDLAAVIVHHGNGSSCGHYTSFAINNGVWMHFNDHTVKEVSPDAVADCKPYILFYIKRELNKSS